MNKLLKSNVSEARYDEVHWSSIEWGQSIKHFSWTNQDFVIFEKGNTLTAKAKENEKTVNELNQALVNLEQFKKNVKKSFGIEQIFFKDLKIGIP